MKCLHLLLRSAMKVLLKDETEIAAISSWCNWPYICNSRMFVFTGTILLALVFKLITLRNRFQLHEQVRITFFPIATQTEDFFFLCFHFSAVVLHVMYFTTCLSHPKYLGLSSEFWISCQLCKSWGLNISLVSSEDSVYLWSLSCQSQVFQINCFNPPHNIFSGISWAYFLFKLHVQPHCTLQ